MDSSIKKKITGPQNMKKQSHKNKKLIKKELLSKKNFAPLVQISISVKRVKFTFKNKWKWDSGER